MMINLYLLLISQLGFLFLPTNSWSPRQIPIHPQKLCNNNVCSSFSKKNLRSFEIKNATILDRSLHLIYSTLDSNIPNEELNNDKLISMGRSESNEQTLSTKEMKTLSSHNTDTNSETGIHRKVAVSETNFLNNIEIPQNLSKSLSLPLIYEEDTSSSIQEYSHLMTIVPYQLTESTSPSYAIALQPIARIHNRTKSKKRNKPQLQSHPFFIDFLPPMHSNMRKRLNVLQEGSSQELLLKAIIPGKSPKDINTGLFVYDLTTGFAQDSMIMALSNKITKVVMIERDPIVSVLLQDAMRRLQDIASISNSDESCPDVQKAKLLLCKIELFKGDSSDLQNLIDDRLPVPDVCYLDPMFPPRTKSAAVKKNMQILQSLLEPNKFDDSQMEVFENQRLVEERKLLSSALNLATSRVVVKRPINSPPLGENDYNAPSSLKPSYSLKGSINRFDIYLVT